MLFTNGGKILKIQKRRKLKLDTHLAKLTLNKYLGPHKVSACWSSCIFTAALYGTTETRNRGPIRQIPDVQRVKKASQPSLASKNVFVSFFTTLFERRQKLVDVNGKDISSSLNHNPFCLAGPVHFLFVSCLSAA